MTKRTPTALPVADSKADAEANLAAMTEASRMAMPTFDPDRCAICGEHIRNPVSRQIARRFGYQMTCSPICAEKQLAGYK